MATESKETVTIIGGGLVGSLMAIFLARRGFCVDVYERRPDMRATQINAGRSINMAMSLRGIYALGQVGVVDEVMDLAIPMRGRMIHSSQGDLKLHPYGKNETEVIHSVSRGKLNKTLITAAERYDGVRFFFHESGVIRLNNKIRSRGPLTRIVSPPFSFDNGSFFRCWSLHILSIPFWNTNRSLN